MTNRYQITHKLLKHHLKVIVTDTKPAPYHDANGALVVFAAGETEGWDFKLSYPQWAALTRDTTTVSKRRSMAQVPPEVANRIVLGYTTEWATQEKLAALDLTESVEFEVAEADYRGKLYTRLAEDQVLTPLGVAVKNAIPVCPDRSKWPERPRIAPSTVKPTKPQQRMLDAWPTHKGLAVPIGGTEAQISRWAAVGKGRPEVSLTSMAQKGLLEVGLRGVELVDGKLKVTGVPTIVYRPTVLGALMGK